MNQQPSKICALLALFSLVACAPQTGDVPANLTGALPRMSPALTASGSATAVPTDTPMVTRSPAAGTSPDVYPTPFGPTPESPIGGGVVKSGPFVIHMWLVRNPLFGRNPSIPSLYSDMEGIALYSAWVYVGDQPIGPVEIWDERGAPLDSPGQTPLSVKWNSIRYGDSEIREGGIFLYKNSRAGDRLQAKLVIHTPNGDYGALLHFTLAEAPGGFEPVDISVEPLPATHQKPVSPLRDLPG